MKYRPASFVTADTVMLVASFLAVTAAPASTPPVVSATVPVIVATSDWANRAEGTKKQRTLTHAQIVRRDMNPPFGEEMISPYALHIVETTPFLRRACRRAP